MTYYKVLCEVCDWMLNEYLVWNIYPDRVQVIRDALCPLCLAERESEWEREQPLSWFEPETGEAGA